MSYIVFFFFSSLLLIFFFYNSKKISQKTFLYKKLLDDTPLTGGPGIYLYFILGSIYFYIINGNLGSENIYLIVLISLIFIIGLLDDIFNINYKIRLVSLFLIIFIFLKFDERFIVNELYFETINQTYLLGGLSLFITPIFIMLLLNSINMADGINGNSGFIFLSYFFLLFENNDLFNNYFIFFIIPLVIFLYFNLTNKIYLGDSGVYLISIIVSLFVIYKYKYGLSYLSCEKIFLIFMIPGIDMFRLFCFRIYNKINPFEGDLNHLHHLLIKRFSNINSLIIYSSLILWPNLILYFFSINKNILIILNLLIYFYIIMKLKKLEKFS